MQSNKKIKENNTCLDNIKRCKWVNLKNPDYVFYHDKIWGREQHGDRELFKALCLEIFQSGLSFEIVLNKQKNIAKAFDNFDFNKIKKYDILKKEQLNNDKGIIRNKRKIEAIITNAQVFSEIIKEFDSFDDYIWKFSNYKVIYENNKTNNNLSLLISLDLKKRGMKFVGDITIYSFLQAIGMIYSHDENCFLCKRK